MIGLNALAFFAGAALTLATSWVLVSRLERIGEALGLSEALLGLLAALAADAPEITSAVTALVHHERTVGAGVVIGSNVFNLATLLGLGVLVAGRIALHRKVVVLAGAVALWLASVTVVTVTAPVPPAAGLGLVLAVVVPYVVILGAHRNGVRRLPLPTPWTRWLFEAVSEEELELFEAIRPRRGRRRDAVEAVIALVVVVVSSATMERAAASLGRHFSVPAAVVGGLVLAAVTSLPNAVAAIYLAARGRGAATMSTALNSNSLNVVAGFLLPATVLGGLAESSPTTLMAGWYLAMTALTLVMAHANRGLTRSNGLLIVASYAGFVATMVAIT